MSRRTFYVVVINTPDIIGIVGLVEEIPWKPWKFTDDARDVKAIERAAIEKGHTVTYQDAHMLPGWAFEKLLYCVVERYRQSYKLSNAFDIDWEVVNRIVVYQKA